MEVVALNSPVSGKTVYLCDRNRSWDAGWYTLKIQEAKKYKDGQRAISWYGNALNGMNARIVRI